MNHNQAKDCMASCSILCVDGSGNEFVLAQHTDDNGKTVVTLGNEELIVYQDKGIHVAINRNGRKFFIYA